MKIHRHQDNRALDIPIIFWICPIEEPGGQVQKLVEGALAHLRYSVLEISPRKRLPCDLAVDVDLAASPIEPGRCLTRWGDPGLARLVENGKYREDHFDDRLVDAAADLVARWSPLPSPTWLTWVPSGSAHGLLEDFGRRLADRLGVEAVDSLERLRRSQPQKTMENSCQQARNVAGAFSITDSRPDPVLLIDDMVDSRWTFTMKDGANHVAAASWSPMYLALIEISEAS